MRQESRAQARKLVQIHGPAVSDASQPSACCRQPTAPAKGRRRSAPPASRACARKPLETLCSIRGDPSPLANGESSPKPAAAPALCFAIAAALEQLGRIDAQGVREAAKDRDAHRRLPALDLPNVADAEPDTFREFLLRPGMNMAQPSQIDRHHILEIAHSARGTPKAVSCQE